MGNSGAAGWVAARMPRSRSYAELLEAPNQAARPTSFQPDCQLPPRALRLMFSQASDSRSPAADRLPASIGRKPRSVASSEATALASASSPATSASRTWPSTVRPGARFAAKIVLKAFTILASGSQAEIVDAADTLPLNSGPDQSGLE